MYVARVPNRSSPPAILLRESYRAGDKVKTRTLANLSGWPEAKIHALSRLLKDEAAPVPADRFAIERALPHGHIAAVLGMARKLGLDRLLPHRPSRLAKLALAMIVARVVEPAAKLATARQLSEATAAHSLGAVLALDQVDEDELYLALDLLLAAQPRIETALARRHLKDGCLVLYDLTSSYLEGRCCPLARYGYSRDDKPGKLQIVYGLLCAADGCPVAVEVFDGNVGDPSTLAAQIGKLKERFKLGRVVLVGDRGMITQARIQRDLATERARKRAELLAATERDLAAIAAAVTRPLRALRGIDKIALRAGAVLGRRKMAKHFALTITDTTFAFTRNTAAITREAALDGFYVLRTNVPAALLDTAATVLAYKSLAGVERAFRSIKTVDLEIRPIHHRLADRVRAHVFLCMLAYYLIWHLRRAWAELLFDDHDRAAAAAARPSPVAAAKVSPAAQSKAASKRTAEGRPVHSFRSLLHDHATLTRNLVRFGDAPPVVMLARPTALQQHAFDRLAIAIAP